LSVSFGEKITAGAAPSTFHPSTKNDISSLLLRLTVSALIIARYNNLVKKKVLGGVSSIFDRNMTLLAVSG
jgi:hypothetical protein